MTRGGSHGWIIALSLAVVAVSVFGLPTLEKKTPAKPAPVAHREVSVIQTLNLGGNETIRVLSVPDPLIPDPDFDSRCLLHTNERGQATFHCLPRHSPSPG